MKTIVMRFEMKFESRPTMDMKHIANREICKAHGYPCGIPLNVPQSKIKPELVKAQDRMRHLGLTFKKQCILYSDGSIEVVD